MAHEIKGREAIMTQEAGKANVFIHIFHKKEERAG